MEKRKFRTGDIVMVDDSDYQGKGMVWSCEPKKSGELSWYRILRPAQDNGLVSAIYCREDHFALVRANYIPEMDGYLMTREDAERYAMLCEGTDRVINDILRPEAQ